jgi:hypothetical protein
MNNYGIINGIHCINTINIDYILYIVYVLNMYDWFGSITMEPLWNLFDREHLQINVVSCLTNSGVMNLEG